MPFYYHKTPKKTQQELLNGDFTETSVIVRLHKSFAANYLDITCILSIGQGDFTMKMVKFQFHKTSQIETSFKSLSFSSNLKKLRCFMRQKPYDISSTNFHRLTLAYILKTKVFTKYGNEIYGCLVHFYL